MGRNHANRYALLDSHGKVAPGDVSEAIDTLVEYLITPCQNNEEKARVIFRWITENIQYDVQGYFSGNYGDLRPKTVLKTKKSVCSGYAALFEALCVQANVPCQRVVGFAKGYGHDTGHAFDKTNHEWNVIQLEDEQWYLVESTWGAGYINGKIYCKKFVDEYFMMPPEQFITTHLPEDENWQLLPTKITKKEFEDIVAVKPGAHKCGLRVDSHRTGVITLDQTNLLEVRLAVNTGTQLLVNVKEKLGLNKEGKTVENCSVCQQPSPGAVVINLALPSVSKYNVHVFCKSRECTEYEYALTYVVGFTKEKFLLSEEGFPALFSPFMDKNCYIFHPMQERIKEKKLSFKVRVPGAKEVVIVPGPKWIHLKQSPDDDNIFEGTVELDGAKPLGKVGIFANWNSGFTGLAEYSFVPPGSIVVKKPAIPKNDGASPPKKSTSPRAGKELVQKRQPATNTKKNAMKVI